MLVFFFLLGKCCFGILLLCFVCFFENDKMIDFIMGVFRVFLVVLIFVCKW